MFAAIGGPQPLRVIEREQFMEMSPTLHIGGKRLGVALDIVATLGILPDTLLEDFRLANAWRADHEQLVVMVTEKRIGFHLQLGIGATSRHFGVLVDCETFLFSYS